MKAIIIEDQLPAQRIIRTYAERVPFLDIVAAFTNAIDAASFLKHHPVDLIFLDINLPLISGINFLKSLPTPPHVVITSAYERYALEGFELNAADYLLKPFPFERFLRALNKVQGSPPASDPFLFIRSDKEYFQVRLQEVVYVMGYDDYTRVYVGEKVYLDNRTLKAWTSVLPPNFVRVHKSYIINRNFVTKISGQRVFLDRTEIPVGRSYREAIQALIGG